MSASTADKTHLPEGLEQVPLVSIIIPAYNAATLIEETLDSLLNQTHSAIEIIVVDDGSTDNTADVVQRYGRSVILLQQRNSGGCSGPRNTGLRVAKGTFVTFFDADDLMRPDKIARQVACLRSNPELVAVLTDYRNFTGSAPWKSTHFETCPGLTEELNRHSDDLAVLSGDRAQTLLLKENFNISNSPMYHTAALRQIGGFNEDLKSSEDFELIYRIARLGPLGLIRAIGFDRRMHDANMTNRIDHVLRYKIASRAKIAESETDVQRRNSLRHQIGEFHLGLADELARKGNAQALLHIPKAWRYGAFAPIRALKIATKYVVKTLT